MLKSNIKEFMELFYLFVFFFKQYINNLPKYRKHSRLLPQLIEWK